MTGPVDAAADPLGAEYDAVVTDYQKVFRPPWSLPPNLDLARRALAERDAMQERLARVEALADEWERKAGNTTDSVRWALLNRHAAHLRRALTGDTT